MVDLLNELPVIGTRVPAAKRRSIELLAALLSALSVPILPLAAKAWKLWAAVQDLDDLRPHWAVGDQRTAIVETMTQFKADC